MKIGSLNLDSNLILAPMAGVNCAAFRVLCREMGAGLTSTPMIRFDEIINNYDNLIKRVCFLKQEKPISVQLVGNDGVSAGKATEMIQEHAEIIDLNLGCPEKEVLAERAGSFFSKHPEQIKKILNPILSNTNKPVTAKIRIGWEEKSVNVLESVKILEDLGVNAITIHGRTTKQKYSGEADWEQIKLAKEQANIPIIGNGDVFKPGTAKAMIERTKCDAVMIGRGAIGNPLIFKRTKALLETGQNLKETTEYERKQVFKTFLEYYKKYEKNRSFTEIKQQAIWFGKGFRFAKELKQKLLRAKTIDEIKKIYRF